MKTIFDAVAESCNCDREQASEYIAYELDNLKDLLSLGDLRFSDFETACNNLGIAQDYTDIFISNLSLCDF